MFYVYVLYSIKDQGIYIGFTTDLKRRMAEHNDGLSQSTAHRRPVLLAYYEAYYCRPDAEGRERFLKSGSGRTFLKKQMRHFFDEHPLRVNQIENLP
jgi:putative endonuclease